MYSNSKHFYFYYMYEILLHAILPKLWFVKTITNFLEKFNVKKYVFYFKILVKITVIFENNFVIRFKVCKPF
jgi:hypothetical protein